MTNWHPSNELLRLIIRRWVVLIFYHNNKPTFRHLFWYILIDICTPKQIRRHKHIFLFSVLAATLLIHRCSLHSLFWLPHSQMFSSFSVLAATLLIHRCSLHSLFWLPHFLFTDVHFILCFGCHTLYSQMFSLFSVLAATLLIHRCSLYSLFWLPHSLFTDVLFILFWLPHSLFTDVLFILFWLPHSLFTDVLFILCFGCHIPYPQMFSSIVMTWTIKYFCLFVRFTNANSPDISHKITHFRLQIYRV
jgi:hypothetical protein